MRPVGFSTGALALGDFRGALDSLQGHEVDALELSALRTPELAPLLDALPHLNLSSYRFVSLHAPTDLDASEAVDVADRLIQGGMGYPVVAHPDVLRRVDAWAPLGPRLLLENMDRRKPTGRTAEELAAFFEALPQAGLCFDIGHARQVDRSLTEAVQILERFGDRLQAIHVSSVGSDNRHYPLDLATTLACHRLSQRIPDTTPIIIEARLESHDIERELRKVRRAFRSAESLVAAGT